jgi:hypothetical protein
MKQYRIFYRRAGAEKWGNLQPAVHAGLYDVPPVHAALAAIRQHPEIEAVCVRNDDALLNIVVSDQEALAPNAFILETGVPQ